MKIKTKKQLNLPQLIEWGFNNPELVEGKLYLTKEHDKYSPYVQFSVDGYGVRTSQSISKDDTFTIEVEEEITENTVLPILITRNTSGGYNEWKDTSINWFFSEYISAIYILNDDLTLTLVWTKDKGLVE